MCAVQQYIKYIVEFPWQQLLGQDAAMLRYTALLILFI
jgi:hypothetical protein